MAPTTVEFRAVLSGHAAALPSNTTGTQGLIAFQWLIGLLGAVALSAPARRIGVPYPAFLADGIVMGCAASSRWRRHSR
jgi:hypothetical protein